MVISAYFIYPRCITSVLILIRTGDPVVLITPTYACDRRHMQSLRETPTPLIRSRFNDHLNEAHTASSINRTVVSQLG